MKKRMLNTNAVYFTTTSNFDSGHTSSKLDLFAQMMILSFSSVHAAHLGFLALMYAPLGFTQPKHK